MVAIAAGVRSTALILLVTATAAFAQAATTPEPQCGGVTGDPELAIKACTRLIEFGSLDRPELARAYYTRGTEWANQGNHDRAIADFNMAAELDPKFEPTFYNRALSWSNKGEPDRAIADYDAALRLSPRDVNAYVGRASEWITKSDYKRAVLDYEEAIRVMPRSATAYFGRGRARFYAGDFMSAASDFYRAHQLDASVYSALWLYLARKRADIPGEQTLAQDAGTSGSGPWPAPVVALYLGSTTPDIVMRSTSHPDATRQRELQCEASFYVGEYQLLRGARNAAVSLLRDAESTCPRSFIEREGAIAELKRLQPKT